MTEKSPSDVSIVIPAYAEEHRIGRAVTALRRFAGGFPRLREVIIVVEPSGDRTVEVAHEAADGDPLIRMHVEEGHRGKGYAVRLGMLMAEGDLVFFMDTDLSVPLSHVAPFVGVFDGQPGTDIVIGNRRLPSSVIARHQSWLRERAGRCFNRAVRALGLSASTDTQCGFKAFRREAAREIFGRAQIDGFAFDTEILLLAQRLGCHIEERPVEWFNDHESKFRALSDGWRSLRDLWRVRRMFRP